MRAALAALLLAFAMAAFGQASEIAKADPAVEERLKKLAEELRCHDCQNKTIADSNAPLALDLRNQIRVQIAQGRSDAEIRDYMVARYGDFVLYRPPFKASTAVLWLGPFLLVLVGIGLLVRLVRGRRTQPAADAAPPGRRAEIEALLEERPAPGKARGNPPPR
jgi:cytochrome c-type biogenesis protein CcmH